MKKLLAISAGLLIAAASSADDHIDTLAAGGLTFEFSEPFSSQTPTSSMRAGQLLYDHEDEALSDVEVVLFFFGGTGGSTQANLDRWLGQFQGTPESKIEEVKYGETTVTHLVAKGTFMESMGGGPFSGNKEPRENYVMLAAIVPAPQGNVFVKATGPSESMMAMKEAFDAFVASPFAE
ncbi:MAG: hypothetical protein AAF236_09555 [Verrucomicrobiota bacterium]